MSKGRSKKIVKSRAKGSGYHLAGGILLSFIFLFILPSISGAAPGETGMSILKHTMGPRPVAMADAFVAVADDVNSLQYNPAGLVFAEAVEITGMMMRKYISGMDYQYAAFVIPGKKREALMDMSTEERPAVEMESSRLKKLRRSLMALMTREELVQFTKDQMREERGRATKGKYKPSRKEYHFSDSGTDLRLSFGASILDFDAGGMEVEYEFGEGVSVASAQHDYVITVGGGLGNDTFGVGLNVKYVDSSLMDGRYRASALAVDLGGIYALTSLAGGTPLKFGGCIQNIGFATGYSSYKDELPVTSRLGVAANFNLMKALEIDFDIIPTVEAVWPRHSHMQVSIGCEASTELRDFSGDRMIIRAGFKTGQDIKDYFIFGIGFRLANFQVEFSGVPAGYGGLDFGGMETNMMFSVSLRF